MAPRDARRRARREFGNPAVFQDASRDLFSFHPIEDLVRDLRYAGRETRRSAGFTAIAVPAALATSRPLASQLYGVDARDPWTRSSVAILLCVVAMGAVFSPARLASRIDPTTLLRHE
jgi:hypothetical protein